MCRNLQFSGRSVTYARRRGHDEQDEDDEVQHEHAEQDEQHFSK